MTSKETINNLRKENFKQYNYFELVITSIENDLEILEIIKRNKDIIFAEKPNYNDMSGDDFLKLSKWISGEQ